MSNTQTGDAAIFLTNLQEGESIHELRFPHLFPEIPSVTTDLYVDDAEEIIPYALSGVTDSGCFAVFANNVPAGYTLSTFVANNLGAVLSIGTQNTRQIVNPSNLNSSDPIVSTSIQNSSDDPIIPHSISGVNQGSYKIIFADDIPSNNYSVITNARTNSAEYNFSSTLPAGSSSFDIALSNPSKQWFSTPLTKDSIEAIISYPEQFASSPIVLPSVEVSGENVHIPYSISGINDSNYALRFASAIPSEGWSVHTIAHV